LSASVWKGGQGAVTQLHGDQIEELARDTDLDAFMAVVRSTANHLRRIAATAGREASRSFSRSRHRKPSP